MFNRNKKVRRQFDWILFLTVAALCAYGLIVLNSAVHADNDLSTLRTQIISTAAGFLMIFITLFIDTDFLKRLALPVYLISILLLVATLLIGFGEDEWGARSWLKLGPMTFQPAEFVKLGMILALATALDKYKSEINRPRNLIRVLCMIALPLILIMKQPDFGTMMVFLFFMAIMIFSVGLWWRYIAIAVGAVLVAIPVVYTHLDKYQQNRILNFLDPSRDPLGSTYQGTQGTIAIGSGQLFGRGYMHGTQTQFGFIPEQHTDYIFAVLAEEFGFLGGVLLIGLYFLLLYRILVIARRSKDTFGATFAIGIAAMIFVHVFENIGMTIGLMPVTGIPLPFMSSGGTFQLINLLSIGLVLSIGMQRRPLDFNSEP